MTRDENVARRRAAATRVSTGVSLGSVIVALIVLMACSKPMEGDATGDKVSQITGAAGTATVPGEDSPITDDELFDPCTLPLNVTDTFGLVGAIKESGFNPPLPRWKSCVWSQTGDGSRFGVGILITAYTYQELLNNPTKDRFIPTTIGGREATYFSEKDQADRIGCKVAWGTSTGTTILDATTFVDGDGVRQDPCPIVDRWVTTVLPHLPT